MPSFGPLSSTTQSKHGQNISCNRVLNCFPGRFERLVAENRDSFAGVRLRKRDPAPTTAGLVGLRHEDFIAKLHRANDKKEQAGLPILEPFVKFRARERLKRNDRIEFRCLLDAMNSDQFGTVASLKLPFELSRQVVSELLAKGIANGHFPFVEACRQQQKWLCANRDRLGTCGVDNALAGQFEVFDPAFASENSLQPTADRLADDVLFLQSMCKSHRRSVGRSYGGVNRGRKVSCKVQPRRQSFAASSWR